MALSAAVLVEFELLPDVEVSELVEVLESDELELEVLESEVLVEDRVEEDALELTACSELALLASESSPLQAAKLPAMATSASNAATLRGMEIGECWWGAGFLKVLMHDRISSQL